MEALACDVITKRSAVLYALFELADQAVLAADLLPLVSFSTGAAHTMHTVPMEFMDGGGMGVTSFDHPLGEARYDAYVPGEVEPALVAGEAAAVELLAGVAGQEDPLWAFGAATAAFDFVVAVAEDLGAVLGGKWVAAAEAATRRAASFRAAIYQRADLYSAIVSAAVDGPVEQRLRADLLRRFERAGVRLVPEQRDRVVAIQATLAELSWRFTQNLRAADAAASITLDGQTVSYSEKTAMQVLQYCDDPAVREHVYRLMISRGGELNGPIVAEILALRQEYAELLGYRDFVDLQRDERMVPDPQALLDKLAAAYRPTAQREHAELLEFARAATGDYTLELTAADVDLPFDGYWAMKLREARGLGLSTSVRVSLDRAVAVMLDALAELYSIRFTPSDAPVWHPDVTAYDVHDHRGRHLARIYCDWYARPGKRPFGAWMSAPYVGTGGQPHLATVVTNVSGPEVELFELRIMWHEFGHALHLAFTETRYRLRGPDDGIRDFLEAPSRIMEFWPLQPEILRRLGVPPGIATSAVPEEQFRVASRKLVRLVRPAIDLAMHRGEAPLAVKQRYLPVPVYPDDATEAHFHHVFAGEYAGGHYAYQWAGVLAADLFTRFASEGVLNPATGAAYAATVLAPGAERDPAESVRAFLGRDPTIDALLARDGIERHHRGWDPASASHDRAGGRLNE